MMYRINIQEGNERQKYAYGKCVLPSIVKGEYPNTWRKYTKTSSLVCEITVPLCGTGNHVNGQRLLCDSGNPPLPQTRCVWVFSHQEAKVLTGGVTRGTY